MAIMLCGFPTDRYRTAETVYHLAGMVFSMCEAIESGHLPAKAYYFNSDWHSVSGTVRVEDIAVWARTRNINWPPLLESDDNNHWGNVWSIVKTTWHPDVIAWVEAKGIDWWLSKLREEPQQVDVKLTTEFKNQSNTRQQTNNSQNQTNPHELVALNTDLAEQLRQAKLEIANQAQLLQQAKKDIAALKANTPAFRHMTRALTLVAEVQNLYWGDSWKPGTTPTPKQDVIIRELKEKYVISGATASKVEFVACPIDRTTGKQSR